MILLGRATLISSNALFFSDATVYFDPNRMKAPSTKEEILQIVNEAIESDQKIRVVGSGHSRGKVAHSNDIIVSLHNYKGIFKFDNEKKQVCFKSNIQKFIDYWT